MEVSGERMSRPTPPADAAPPPGPAGRRHSRAYHRLARLFTLLVDAGAINLAFYVAYRSRYILGLGGDVPDENFVEYSDYWPVQFALVALVLFISYTVRIARRDVTVSEAREIGAHVEDRDLDQPPSRTRARVVMPLVVLLGGVVALVIGGRLLVDGAVALARLAGMSERQIALTIVAGGTGAPELATSLVAAFRRRTDVAVANMIGSNIFNVLGILGVAAMVTPIPVSAGIIQSDLWWMIGTALLALPLLWSGRMLSRIEGAVLTTAYLTYVVLLLRS